jgi:hypothetical protein
MQNQEGSAGIYEQLGQHLNEKVAENPFQRDEEFLQRLLPLMDIWSRYFAGEVTGFERLP